jgi:hypothetical protein
MDDDRYTRITLRIPKDLHAMLQESADASSKSINAEIVGRVQQSFDGSKAEPIEELLRQLLGRMTALEAAHKKRPR